jgi:cbb3-type cytochrome oxidase subunit 1
MRGVGFWFFLVAVLCVTCGMLWGIHMAISGDHLMAPAHAHLNLIGWVTMGLFGIYYTLTPQAAARPLAKIHFAVALAGVVVMIPGIVLAIRETTEAVVAVGALLTLASMLIFLVTVLRHGLGRLA